MSEIRFYDDLSGQGRDNYDATITPDGLLHLPAACGAHFPDGLADCLVRGGVLWLMPADDGSLELVQRTLAGARTVDLRDAWPEHPTGLVRATWVAPLRRLEIARTF